MGATLLATYFISDLHLNPQHPETITWLFDRLKQLQQDAEALYILGDLFEYWLGDDCLNHPIGQPYLPVIQALKALSQSGVALYFIHGNRDFLIADAFEKASGCQLLAEQTVIDLYGRDVLIMHGDTLCTDDVEYQQMRRMFRSAEKIQQLLSLSIEERLQTAKQLRQQSRRSQQGKSEQIMDVNQQTVETVMQKAQVNDLIHGHTHRLATHHFTLKEQAASRIVLGDWYEKTSVLRCDAQGCCFLP